MVHRACILAFALLLGGCTIVRATSPPRSAAEELLLSTAADRAAEKLAESIPVGLCAYFDGQYLSGTDSSYTAATIRDQLLRHGITLTETRDKAQAIITPRMGALATNEVSTQIGLPGLPVPAFLVPGTTMNTPELNLFKQEEADGIAKLAATVTDTKTGKLIVATEPAYGYSRRSNWVLLFLFSWHESDLGKGERNPDYRMLP